MWGGGRKYEKPLFVKKFTGHVPCTILNVNPCLRYLVNLSSSFLNEERKPIG